MCILRMYGGGVRLPVLRRTRGGVELGEDQHLLLAVHTDGVACRAAEYYLGVGEAPGRWHGRGLEQLGLAAGAVVSERELEALFARGLHPTTALRLGRAWERTG